LQARIGPRRGARARLPAPAVPAAWLASPGRAVPGHGGGRRRGLAGGVGAGVAGDARGLDGGGRGAAARRARVGRRAAADLHEFGARAAGEAREETLRWGPEAFQSFSTAIGEPRLFAGPIRPAPNLIEQEVVVRDPDGTERAMVARWTKLPGSGGLAPDRRCGAPRLARPADPVRWKGARGGDHGRTQAVPRLLDARVEDHPQRAGADSRGLRLPAGPEVAHRAGDRLGRSSARRR